MSFDTYVATLGLVLSALGIGMQIKSYMDSRKHKK